MQQIYPLCPIKGHDLNIQELCIQKNCFTTPTACCKCGRERHSNHNDKLLSLDEIKGKLKEERKQLNNIMDLYKQQIEEYKVQLELVFKYQFDQIEEFLQNPNYSSIILEKIAQFLKKDEYKQIYVEQQKLISDIMKQQIQVLENVTKNIDFQFCKEYALFENNTSTIQEHDISKFASMNENFGLLMIGPELNHIQLNTIIMKFKLQKVNWLCLGVTKDILNYENNVACTTNHGTLYSTFNDQQQDTKQINFEIRENDVVLVAIIKAENKLIICNQTKNCQVVLTNIDFKDTKFFFRLMETEVQVLD